jgi:hypothetical protein
MYNLLSYELAAARRHDMRLQAANARRAREARELAAASHPPATRRGRRTFQLLPGLRPQSQA